MAANDHKQSDLSLRQVQQAHLLAWQTGTKFVVHKPDAANTTAEIAQTLGDDN